MWLLEDGRKYALGLAVTVIFNFLDSRLAIRKRARYYWLTGCGLRQPHAGYVLCPACCGKPPLKEPLCSFCHDLKLSPELVGYMTPDQRRQTWDSLWWKERPTPARVLLVAVVECFSPGGKRAYHEMLKAR